MPREVLEQRFGVRVPDDVPASFNIAPGQPVLAVTLFEGRRELMGFVWGLVPPWANSPGRAFINARSETVFDKPAFRTAAAHHRCLVPASFFYEWKSGPGRKQPHLVRLPGGQPFAMAAIHAKHPSAGPTLAVLTTTASPEMAPIHERMPVIVEPEHHERWLAPFTAREELQELLAPWPGALEAHPVSERVNSPTENDRELTRAVPPAPSTRLGSLPLS